MWMGRERDSYKRPRSIGDKKKKKDCDRKKKKRMLPKTYQIGKL